MVQWLRQVSGCKEFEVGEGGGAIGTLGSRRTLVEGQSVDTELKSHTHRHKCACKE